MKKTKKKVQKKKKTSKKVQKKKKTSKSGTHHIVEVRVKAESQPQTGLVVQEQITPKDLEPIKEGGKFMIPKTWVSERQAIQILQKTPPQYVMSRPAKGGGSWDYVPGWYIQKVLNFTFGWNWDYEVVQEPTVSEIIQLIENKIDQLWVTGKLTVKDDKGHSIVKTQTGRADIKFRKGTRTALDIGNDLKSAHTDALKKCASQLGIASDIYGRHELKSEGYDFSDNTNVVKTEIVKQQKSVDELYECHGCGNPITAQEAEYSSKMFGKPLCRECQKSAITPIKK